MKLEFSKFISAVSRATDYVEAEILSISPYHEKRVGIIANAMGKAYGMDADTLYALTMAGALHDCALSNNLDDEQASFDESSLDLREHCETGENLLLRFPFYHNVKGAILHHHDRADGEGAMGLRAEETPLPGQILHLADRIDIQFGLSTMDQEKYKRICRYVEEERDKSFSPLVISLFFQAVDYPLLESITGDGSIAVLEEKMPPIVLDVPMPVMREMSTFFAHITDHKSHFTWRHSLGIAEKAEMIGRYYGYDQNQCDELFISGALHDIGKLLISNDILEKPGKLTKEEYKAIQNHAMGTWQMLHGIGGMEKICRWASLHHEKLDGSGYPFGLKGEELEKHERLMACLDIYQALVEERPYKAGMPHSEAIALLRKMGGAGQLDQEIIEDIDKCHAIHDEPEISVPRPEKENRHYEGEAWRCPVCGFVYEGELPEDFICPLCEQPASIFEKISS